jgi:hypothetical protein
MPAFADKEQLSLIHTFLKKPKQYEAIRTELKKRNQQ